MFSSVRQGTTIYVLDKNGVPSLKIGQVVSFGTPVPKFKTNTPGVGIGMNTEMVIDLKVRCGDQDFDFKQLPCSQSVADYGNAIVSDSREAMLSEVDNVKRKSEDELARTDYNNNVLSACDGIFRELNPGYAKDKERDEAIQNLNERFSNLEQQMSSWFSNIEKSLSKGGITKV